MTRLACLALISFAASLPLPLQAENWPSFRGPTGMGQTSETDLPLTWNKDGTNVLWKSPLPGTEQMAKTDHSQSSPIIWKDRIFVTTCIWPKELNQSEIPEQHVSCYSLADGKQLWDTLVPAGPWKLSDLRGGYAAPTPCTDGERVYVLFGSSRLAALDLDGKIIWSQEVPDWKDFDVCIAASPVLHDGKLYLLADRGGNKSSLSALDPKTGDSIWQIKRQTGFSHTTPVFITQDGKSLMLIGGQKSLEALDPASGERVWWFPISGDVTSPVFAGGLIYTDSGRGGKGVCVAPTGSGELKEDQVKWSADQIPEGLSSPVIAGDYLYRLHNPGVLRCVDWKTGEVLYKERLEGLSVSSSPIATPDGRVYLASAGKTFVLQAGSKLEILATNDLGEPHASAPAVSQKKIVLKGSKHLFCIGTK
jgi:outer membrane protein assembly factor BamB